MKRIALRVRLTAIDEVRLTIPWTKRLIDDASRTGDVTPSAEAPREDTSDHIFRSALALGSLGTSSDVSCARTSVGTTIKLGAGALSMAASSRARTEPAGRVFCEPSI